MTTTIARTLSGALALSGLALPCAFAAQPAEDLGKKACVVEARRLCPAEMKTMRRKRVEACMIAHIEQTSTICHAAMLRIKAERESSDRAARP